MSHTKFITKIERCRARLTWLEKDTYSKVLRRWPFFSQKFRVQPIRKKLDKISGSRKLSTKTKIKIMQSGEGVNTLDVFRSSNKRKGITLALGTFFISTCFIAFAL